MNVWTHSVSDKTVEHFEQMEDADLSPGCSWLDIMVPPISSATHTCSKVLSELTHPVIDYSLLPPSHAL